MFCPSCRETQPDEISTCSKCGGELTSRIPLSIGEEEPKSVVQPEPQDASVVSTAPPSPPTPDTTDNQKYWLVSTCLLATLLGYAIYSNESKKNDFQPTPTPPPAVLGSNPTAERWLESARKSVDQGDYAIAVSQYEKALALLKDSQASNAELLEVKTEYAESLEKDGRWDRALPLWKALSDTNPDALARAEKAEKSVITQAQSLLEQSQQSRKSGRLTEAVNQAEQAQRLFRDFRGSNNDLALALQRMAEAHIELKRPLKAESELKQAQRLAFTKEREKLLAGIALQPVKPQTQASNSQRNGKDVVVKRPNLGEGDNVPKAAPRVAPKTNTAESTQVKRQPMREIEAYQKNSDETGSTEDSRIGQRDVVKGYNTRPAGGKSKIPGLR